MRIDSRLERTLIRRTSEPPRRGRSAEFARLLESRAAPANAAAASRGTGNASGTPAIVLNAQPAANPWNYTGPASLNPFYATPGNPLRDGNVAGFEKWFEPVEVRPAGASGGGYTMTRAYGATEEGAREALRLVQQYVPQACLESEPFGGVGWAADRPIFYIALPNGQRMTAGLILERYYNRGQGVTAASDIELAQEIRQLSGGAA